MCFFREGDTRAISTDDSFSHNLFFSFSLLFGRVKDDERRTNAFFFSFSPYVYAVVAEKYRVKKTNVVVAVVDETKASLQQESILFFSLICVCIFFIS
jgi:hypothetical protein